MAYGELRLGPERRETNAVNGRFLKGHTSHNKGKKWDDFMSKAAQRRAAKGWKNLEKYRYRAKENRSAYAGRNKKAVIAVMDDGTWKYFPHVGIAGRWSGGTRENVGRCCRYNESRHVNKKNGKVNTDHRYKGVRFYFETDSIWTTKINND